MMRGLWTAASGMTAQQTNLDVIANNLANVNTTGFKTDRANFQDLMYQTLRSAGSTTGDNSIVPTGIQIGLGVSTASVQKVFSTGDFKQTNNSLDVAIQGNGFFSVLKPDGTVAYTRDGALQLDANRRLCNANGYPLEPTITLPANAQSYTIGPDGTVTASVPGQTAPVAASGKIQLTLFPNPAGLSSIGNNLFVPTAACGQSVTGDADSAGFGSLASNTLEMSNVNVVTEMVNMIVAQRAYESNSKAIQSADNMLQMVNQLSRG